MNQIAQTILDQIGGNRFVAMTGSNTFVYDETSLRFKIGRGAKNKATHCHITLDLSTDTYTVSFYKIRGVNFAHISEQPLVYADQLRDVFTAATGFYTSLGTMRGAA